MADAKIATVYAEALLKLVLDNAGTGLEGQKSALEALEAELGALMAALREDQTVWDFFRSPVVGPAAKQRVLDQVLKNSLSKELYNFTGVLNARGRLNELPAIMEAYVKLADDQVGRRRVTVYSAQKLSDTDREQLLAAVKSYFDRNIIMENELKPELIGGLVVRSGDHVLDTSIQSRLKRFKQIMLDQKIAGETYYEN
ncbi:MAG: ATP synthase F1 subunit delta [Leptospirales bacterium]|jgi:F-type H+-transporting ATPase subunit delta